MRRIQVAALALILLVSGALLAGQEVPRQDILQETPPEPVFVRLTVYPTASLSRYDFNNDIDHYEVRAYMEIRESSQSGDVIPDARIRVLGQALEFQGDHYAKRILVDKDDLPSEIQIEIALQGRAPEKRTFPLPSWIVLQEPRPSAVDSGQDLAVGWTFTRFSAPVDVQLYDFRKGDPPFIRNNVAEQRLTVSADRVPAGTIVRIFVIQSWLSKRYLTGEFFSRGSEINIIPWSQVFIRTK